MAPSEPAGCTFNPVERINQYLQANGTVYESSRVSESVAAFLRSQPLSSYKMKQCYANAWKLALEGERAGLIAVYVEGLAGNNFIPPLPHAWNLIEGTLVDTTWGSKIPIRGKHGTYYRRTDRIIGDIPQGFKYIGVEIPVEVVSQYLLKHNRFDSLLNDGCCDFPLLRKR